MGGEHSTATGFCDAFVEVASSQDTGIKGCTFQKWQGPGQPFFSSQAPAPAQMSGQAPLSAQVLAVQVTESLQPDMTEEAVSDKPASEASVGTTEEPTSAKSAVEETVDLPHEETPAMEGASDVPSNVPDSPQQAEQPPAATPEASSSSNNGTPCGLAEQG